MLGTHKKRQAGSACLEELRRRTYYCTVDRAAELTMLLGA
jgi:hypothetical protein